MRVLIHCCICAIFCFAALACDEPANLVSQYQSVALDTTVWLDWTGNVEATVTLGLLPGMEPLLDEGALRVRRAADNRWSFRFVGAIRVSGDARRASDIARDFIVLYPCNIQHICINTARELCEPLSKKLSSFDTEPPEMYLYISDSTGLYAPDLDSGTLAVDFCNY